MKKYLEITVASLIIAGTVVGTIRLIGAVPISVTSTAKQSTFDVQGEGKVVVKPDQARVSLGVHKEGVNVKAATEETDKVMMELSKRLKSLGIKEDDIKTTNYSVYQNWTGDGSSTKTYTVNSSVEVTVREIDKTGEVVDLIGALKLEQSGGLVFSLSDELREKSTKEAREKAIGEAKKKAEQLSSIAGMKLGRIVNVTEGYNGGYPVPMYAKAEARDMVGSGAPAQIETGTSDVAVSVTLSYETL